MPLLSARATVKPVTCCVARTGAGLRPQARLVAHSCSKRSAAAPASITCSAPHRSAAATAAPVASIQAEPSSNSPCSTSWALSATKQAAADLPMMPDQPAAANLGPAGGMLAAEFDTAALQYLNTAAVFATSQPYSSSATSSTSSIKKPAAALTAPSADAAPTIQGTVTVTEQHLLLALLHDSSDALQLLGQHLAVDRDQAAAALQQIKDRVSALHGSGSSRSSAAVFELSDGLMLALNKALAITRQQGLPAVSWAGLAWGIVMAPDAPTAHEQLLEAAIYSGDLAEALVGVMAQARYAQAFIPDPSEAATAQLPGSAARSSGSSSAPTSANSERNDGAGAAAAAAALPVMFDGTLDAALAHITNNLAATNNHKAAVQSVCGIISATAAAGFQPKTSWLQQAWQVANTAAASMRQSHLCFKPDTCSGGQQIIQALVAAAHTSAFVFKFSSPHMSNLVCSLRPSAPNQGMSAVTSTWLQWAALLSAAGTTANTVKQFLEEYFSHSLSAALCSAPPQLLAEAFPSLVHVPLLGGSVPYAFGFWEALATRLNQEVPSVSVETACRLPAACSVLLSHNVPGLKQESWIGLPGVAHGVVQALGANRAAATAHLLQMHAGVRSSNHLQHLQLSSRNVLQDRLLQQRHMPAAVQLAAAVLESPGGSQPLAPAAEVVADCPLPSALSLQQLEVFVRGLASIQGQIQKQVQQGQDSNKQAAEDATCKLQGLYLELAGLAMPVVMPALEAVAGSTAQAAAQQHVIRSVASILNSMSQLPASVPADTVQRLQGLLPQLLPLLEPEEVGQAVGFIGQQLVQDGKKGGKLLAGVGPPTVFAVQALHSAEQSSQQSAAQEAEGDQDEIATAYCTGSAAEADARAAEVAAALKGDAKSALPGDGAAAVQPAPEVLRDMAKALGASCLPVEPAVMDVLAAHVGRCLAEGFVFDGPQLAVLLWAFARKLPSEAAVPVLSELIIEAGTWPAGSLDRKDGALCYWAYQRLLGAFESAMPLLNFLMLDGSGDL